MKKIILTTGILIGLILGYNHIAEATPITLDGDFANQIIQPFASFSSAVLKASSFTATSTTATSTFAGGVQIADDKTIKLGSTGNYTLGYSSSHFRPFFNTDEIDFPGALTIYGNTGLDATGTYSPFMEWNAGGGFTIQADGGTDDKVYLEGTDGVVISSKTGGAQAIYKDDYVSGFVKTFQVPNLSGTFTVMETQSLAPNLILSSSNGNYVVATSSPTAGYFTATSTTASTFNNASTTLLSGTTAWFTNFIGNLTGNADTATSLAANGTNCSAGSYALGVDASGASEGCTDATTEIDSSISTHAGVANAHQDLVTLAGSLDYITLAGQVLTRNAIDLATDVTGDLPFANLTQVSANSVLGNITGSTGDATSVATSSLFTWTGTGNVVRATSPTLVTPALGTPSSLTLTNATGLPIVGGTTGTLSVARGGTGATSLNNLITLATHTTGNYLATLSSSGSLTIANSGTENAAVTANLNMGNANTWTALQTFGNASSSLFSTNYASSTQYFGAGLQTCDATTGKLHWANGVFTCETDREGGSGSTFAWTPTTYSGITTNATTTPLWLKATTPHSLIASSSLFTQASTSQLSIMNAGSGGNPYIFANDTTQSLMIDAWDVFIGDTTLPNQADGILSVMRSRDTFADIGTLSNYFAILQNASNITGQGAGLGFSVTTATDNVTGAIIAERTGSNAQGKLNFYTKSSTVGGDDPTFVMTLSEENKVGIGTTSPYAKLSVVGETVAEYFTATSTTATSTLPRLTATGIATDWLCLNGSCRTTWPSGGGGAGLATSTPIADTWVIYGTSADDVGAESAFTYDDATNLLSVGSATVSATTTTGALQVGSTAIGNNVFKLSPLTGMTVSASESVGGLGNINLGTTDAIGLAIYGNHTGTSRGLSIVQDSASYGGNALHVRSDGTTSAVNVSGAPTGQGIVKIGANGAGDINASVLSLDASTSGFLGQAFFAKCGSATNCYTIVDSGSNTILRFNSNGNMGIGVSSPSYKLDVNGAGHFTGLVDASHFVATSTSATSTFPNLSVTGAFNFLGDYITNVSTWFNGLFDTRFATKTTTDLSEGTNLYYTTARVNTDAPNVTLAGSLDYLTLSGQQITRNAIDLTTDVTGLLPNGNLANSTISGVSLGSTLNALTAGTGLTSAGTYTGATARTFSIDQTFSPVWTGSHDFGGATFLEIPNGTAPVANDPGEIAHDTTGNQLIVDDYVVPLSDQKIWSVTIGSTSPAFISGGLFPVPTQLDGHTITRIQCHVTGGTSKVIAVEDASANSSEDITCGTTNTTDDGSITNATYTASELPYIDFGATSGAVDYVSISVFGNWTRE